MTAWQTPEANANREHFLHCRSCVMQRQRIPFTYLSACYYCTQSVPFSQAEHKAEPIDNSGKKPQKAGTTNKTEHKKHQELHKVRDLVNFLLFVSFWFWGLPELHVPEHSEKMNFVSLRPATMCIWEHPNDFRREEFKSWSTTSKRAQK